MTELERFDALAADMERLRKLAEEADALTQEVQDTSNLPVPTGGNLPATEMKQVMARRRADVLKKKDQVEKLAREIEERVKNQLWELEQVVGPMQEMVARMEEGIWTLNLYLGRDEEIILLTDGAPAPVETPLTIRQMVLSMDEECALDPESDGIDAKNINSFDQWLLEKPEHLEQVLPEQKGVVVLVPRMNRDKDYGDPWHNAVVAEANKQSYWLIRNGEKLYRMTTDFKVGKHLIPRSDEFTSMFEKDPFGRRLEPGSHYWMEAEKKADARKRHYMRSALILQGLIDRTPVFHPLPPEGVNLLDPETYEDGRAVMVTDAELALGTGREPFRAWLRRLNNGLRPGMRVLFWLPFQEFNQHGRESDYGPRRISPQYATGLKAGDIYRIEGKESYFGEEALLVYFERTDKKWEPYEEPVPDKPGWVYRRHREVEYAKRAKARFYKHDPFILPFDLVTVEEMEGYLSARLERHSYVQMIPLLQRAIEAKKAEAEEEAPFRLMLAGVIEREYHYPIRDIDDRLPELVDWWKLANRWHRPLVGEGEDQAKAVQAISKEYHERHRADVKGSKQAQAEKQMAADLAGNHLNACLIARKRDGTYVVLEPADDELVFAHQFFYSSTGKPLRNSKQWAIVPTSWRKWRILWSDERWSDWNHGGSLTTHLTGPEEETLRKAMVARLPRGFTPLRLRQYKGEDQHYVLEAFKPIQVEFPDNPLTGKFPAGLPKAEVSGRWSRTTGMKLVPNLHLREGNRDHWEWSPWRSFFDGGEVKKVDQWGGDQWWRLLWRDDLAIAELEALRSKGKKESQRRERMSSQVGDYILEINKALVAEQEKVAYERFIEDYADPELWEGHRKTLQFQNWPYGSADQCRAVLNVVIERGIPVEGRTIGEITKLARELSGKKLPMEKRLMDIVIGTPPPEDEYDDEDD